MKDEGRTKLATSNRNANRNGRSPACWTQSTEVDGAEGAVNTQRPASRRKGDDIAERLLDLAAAVLGLLTELSPKPGAKSLVKQLERCAPAGGANYEEARGAESSADFVHKVRIALKEVRETRYWLMLLERTGWVGDRAALAVLIDEATELIAILTASANTARKRAALGTQGSIAGSRSCC